jgi:signal transduction histidine kinase/ActR/RegA family two-component response regulator
MAPFDDALVDAHRERLAVLVAKYFLLLAPAPLAMGWWQLRHETGLPLALQAATTSLVAIGALASFLPLPRRIRIRITLGAILSVSVVSSFEVGLMPGSVGTAALACVLAAFLDQPGVAFAMTVGCVAWLCCFGIGQSFYPVFGRLVRGRTDIHNPLNWLRTFTTLVVITLVPVRALVHQLDAVARSARRRKQLLATALEEERRRQDLAAASARGEVERRAAAGLHMLGRLGGGFAHRCSNVLQAIAAEVDLLAMRPVDKNGGRLRDALGDMQEAVASSAAVVRRLLALTGCEGAPVRACVDLAAFVGAAERQLAMIPGLKVINESEPAAMAFVDAASLQAVLLNLALNARDAMAAGGTLRLKARPATESEQSETGCAAAIEVADSGTGMDGATMARIFEPFFTTKGAAGTGLGLVASRRAVEAGGGRLKVVSALGEGTTFTILLPPAIEPHRPRYDGARHRADDSRRVPASPVEARLLIVDDDMAVRQAWRAGLTKCGFSVLEAPSVEDALSIVRTCRVALVWTDAVMAGRPTRELIDEVRRCQPWAHLVVCSGHVEEELLRRDLLSGEVDFIHKPCPLSVLIARARLAADSEERSVIGRSRLTPTPPEPMKL